MRLIKFSETLKYKRFNQMLTKKKKKKKKKKIDVPADNIVKVNETENLTLRLTNRRL